MGNDPKIEQRPLEVVLADIGKQFAADLEGRELLILVFPTKADREEFVALVQKAKPGMAEFHY